MTSPVPGDAESVERALKDRILAELRMRTPCEPTEACKDRFCYSCIERRVWLAAERVVADA